MIDKTVHFTPDVGTDIQEAAIQAVGIAKKESSEVVMHFNDAAVVVQPDHRPHEVIKAYRASRAEISEAYRSSAAGAAAEAEAKALVTAARQKVGELVDSLPIALGHGLSETIRWVREYSLVADHIATDPQAHRVVSEFSRAGYESDAHVGANFSSNDLQVFGQYIIGQFMSGLITHGRPLPIGASFCDAYLKREFVANNPVAGNRDGAPKRRQ